MLVAGIDSGSSTTKAIIVKDGKVLAQKICNTTDDAEISARQVLEMALKMGELHMDDLTTIAATGSGRKFITFATVRKSPGSCLAKSISTMYPEARTVFDMGAETSIVIRLNSKGLVEDFVGHDHCASGTGVFLETMARLMMLPLEDFAALSLTAPRYAELSTMCAVFAESEVISHIHKVPPTPKSEVIAGIHHAMAVRLVGLGKRIGIKPQIVMTGGVARNVGFVKALEEKLEMSIAVPEEPEMMAALGAAWLVPQEKGGAC